MTTIFNRPDRRLLTAILLLAVLITVGASAQETIDWGAAHGAFAMTTPGDTSMGTKAEIERLMRGASARVQR